MSRSGLTATGQFVGTIDYIAPEQIQDKPVDGRADIYSLGCVLYECLTGRVPFPKNVDAAVIWAHVEEFPTAASAVRVELPRGIDDVIVRALAKDPNDRYSTCRELIVAARSALEPAGSRASDRAIKGARATVLRGGGARDPEPEAVVASAAGHASGAVGVGDLHSSGGSPADPPALRPRSRLGRRQLVPVAVVALAIAGGIVAWAVSRGGSPRSASRTGAMPAVAAENPIMHALAVANASATAKGLLPASSCTPRTVSMVMCSRPSFGVETVSFRTLPSLNALYAAYQSTISSLARSPFRANFGECDEHSTSGEVSWNHNFQHPRHYSLEQSRSGMLADDQAAGRVFCTFSNSELHMVWTQNDGRVIGVLDGYPHQNTWNWWHAVHHVIDIRGSHSSAPMSMPQTTAHM